MFFGLLLTLDSGDCILLPSLESGSPIIVTHSLKHHADCLEITLLVSIHFLPGSPYSSHPESSILFTDLIRASPQIVSNLGPLMPFLDTSLDPQVV